MDHRLPRIAFDTVMAAVVAFSAAPPGDAADATQPPERIRAIIAQLGSDDFQERESATAQLVEMEDDALPWLQEARALSQDAEVITRLERILGRNVPGELQWASEPLGQVEASPVILGGRLWVGSQTPKSFALCCLSASRGTILWKADVGSPLVSAPAAEGDRVFCVDREGSLGAFDRLTGKPLWNRPLGAEVRADLAVLEGRIFLARADGKVECMRAETGESIWSQSLGAAGLTRSGAAVADGQICVGGRDNKVHALDAATGAKRWEFDAGAAIVTTPAIDGGRVVTGSADRKLHAVSADKGRPLWSYVAKGPAMAVPALTKDHAILLTAEGTLHVLAITDGTLQWSTSVPFAPGLAPVACGDAIFWIDTGNAIISGHARDGARAWRTPMRGGRPAAGPALAGHRLFVADSDGRILCYSTGISGLGAWPMAGGNARRTGRLDGPRPMTPK